MDRVLILVLVSVIGCGIAGAQSLPDAPRPSSTFWAIAGVDVAATVADGWTTVHYLGPRSRCTEVENPALYGRHPTVVRTTLVMGAAEATWIAGSWWVERKGWRIGRGRWRVPAWSGILASAVTHTRGAIVNVGLPRCGI